MRSWWLGYGVYKVLDDSDRKARVLRELEADLQAQETPNERRVWWRVQLPYTVFKAFIWLPLVIWPIHSFRLWQPHDQIELMIWCLLGLAPWLFFGIWLFVDELGVGVGRAARHCQAVDAEQHRARADRNEQIRQEKIARGL